MTRLAALRRLLQLDTAHPSDRYGYRVLYAEKAANVEIPRKVKRQRVKRSVVVPLRKVG